MTVGEATNNAIAALKGNPLCLAVVVLVLALQMIAYYRESAATRDRMQVITTLVERCMEPAKR